MALRPWVTSNFNYALDYQSVLEGINHMTFVEEKPPGPPVIISEECSSENNTITLVWQPQLLSFVEYYNVEVEEGNNGFYKVVYRGIETVTTVDNLHFNTKYKARVKAFNSKGESPYSEEIQLSTEEGKDDKGWSMYIDHQRSWFLHADHHGNRTEGGVGAECVIGVLLDLDQHQLSFFVNDELQGDVAFSGLQGVFFPAVSINRNVQVTVQTALEPPNDGELGSEIANK
ncbi:E3 ubiquitin-protein ligase TRIM9-like [Limulus polyphemus]|uniref:E3 ubiquitin-protein ligase TRIM9-like n=1 Tax=Limulus polyphemus TaxID=6850 RepID=A0ABM1SL41_LIMPO|nr:E3 ubiquitin-protein ligase TRIM9-like [Limulus polyphemus]XP_022244347.1 E3 ubiquitin-protein ligase TRIM9-like [Limulus polyphemus]